MRIGVVFPQTEIGTDAALIREFSRTAEQLGYRHILAYDHVLGANPGSRPDWRPPYTHRSTFHEPLVLFGYLAGLTQTIELVTGVLILPQRQTALVAKQAAALDLLSGGRLRLGIGIGWIPSSTKRWAKILAIAGGARRNRFSCCVYSGPASSSASRVAGTGSPMPGSIHCRFNGRFRSGLAAVTTACFGV